MEQQRYPCKTGRGKKEVGTGGRDRRDPQRGGVYFYPLTTGENSSTLHSSGRGKNARVAFGFPMMWSLRPIEKKIPSAISAGGSSMWSVEADNQRACLCLPDGLHYAKQFPRSGHSLYTLGCMRGKSGHHRAGFPVKTGGLLEGKFTASATENKRPAGVRVKKWARPTAG